MNSTELDWESSEEVTQPGGNVKTRGARVIIADDDESMRCLLTLALVTEGYDVGVATTGTETLRMLQSILLDAWPLDGVDLLVLDVRMPGLTGIEILRQLRAQHWTTPIIIMTAFADADIVAEAGRYGTSVLSKPFSLDELTSRVAAELVAHQRALGLAPARARLTS
ncbi:MAG: response regulator [Polyangiaceae bacterium]